MEINKKDNCIYCCYGTSTGSVYTHDMVNINRFNVEESRRIEFIRFHHVAPVLFIGTETGKIHIYNFVTHQLIATLKNHLNSVTCLSFIQLKSQKGLGGLVTGGKDKVINIWDLSNISETTPYETDITPSKPSKSRKRSNKKVDSISESKSQIEPVTQIPTEESIDSILCVPTKYFNNCQVLVNKSPTCIKDIASWVIVAGGESGDVTIWNPSEKNKLKILNGPHTNYGSILYIGRVNVENIYRLIAIGEDNIISIWNMETCLSEQMIQAGPTEIIQTQWIRNPMSHFSETFSTAPYNSLYVLSSSSACTFVDVAESWTRSLVKIAHKDTVLCADAHATGCYIATGSKDRSCIVWSTYLKKPLIRLIGHTAPVILVQMNKKLSSKVDCVCVQNKSRKPLHVATVCVDGHLKVWSIIIEDLLADTSIQDSNTFAFESKVSVKKKITSAAYSVLAHKKRINALCIAPNDKLIATGGSEKIIKLWSFPNLDFVGELKGHLKGISALEFSDADRVLFSGSFDKTLKMWNLTDFTCLRTFENFGEIPLSLSVFNYGTQMVSGNSNGILRFFNVQMGDSSTNIDAHQNSKVSSLSMNSGASLALSAGTDNSIIIWKDFTAEAEQKRFAQRQEDYADKLAIENLTRSGNTLEALNKALKVKQPQHIYELIKKGFEQTAFGELDERCMSNCTINQMLQPMIQRMKAEQINCITHAQLISWVCQLSDDLLETLLKAVISWHSIGKLSCIANYILDLIIKYVPFKRLSKMHNFESLAEKFLLHNPKHISRLSSLIQETYLLDILIYTAGCNLLQNETPVESYSIKEVREFLFD